MPEIPRDPFRREPPEGPHDRAIWDLRRLIWEHGWAVRNVLPGPTPDDVAFSYTVGLTALGHPKVIVTGIPAPSAHVLLNLVGDEVRRGKRFEHGTVTGEFIADDTLVVFISAEDTGRPTAVEEIYGRVNTVQMIWLDSAGRLPWQDGYRNPPDAQPLLGPLPD